MEEYQKPLNVHNNLVSHLKKHYNKKPFICPYCDKSFKEKGNLKTHIRIHTGERPFKCKKCKKGFKALGQLKDHLISHTGFKPFQCPFCKKFYRRKEILKNHFIIHEKDTYFQKNKDKFHEMLNNIKNMKNNIYNYDESDNSINKSSALSCCISTNEEKNSNFKIDNNKKNNYIDKIKSNRYTKIYNSKNKGIFSLIKRKNETKEKEKCEKYDYFLNNDALLNYKLFLNDYSNDCPNMLFKIMPKSFDLALKQNNDNEDNQIINNENNENNKNENFIFQNIPNLFEKEKDFSLNNKNNNYNLKEKNIDIDDNEDCCSRMTNLYLLENEDKNINEYLY